MCISLSRFSGSYPLLIPPKNIKWASNKCGWPWKRPRKPWELDHPNTSYMHYDQYNLRIRRCYTVLKLAAFFYLWAGEWRWWGGTLLFQEKDWSLCRREKNKSNCSYTKAHLILLQISIVTTHFISTRSLIRQLISFFKPFLLPLSS